MDGKKVNLSKNKKALYKSCEIAIIAVSACSEILAQGMFR